MAGRYSCRRAGLLFAVLLDVVEELEEHDPGEQRQTVEVAVEPLVLAHDVAGGLDERRAAGRWRGAASVFLRAILAMCARSRGVQQVLQLVTAGRSFSGPPNKPAISITLPCVGDRRHFQNVRHDELRRPVFGVLLQQFVEDGRAPRRRTGRRSPSCPCAAVRPARAGCGGALNARWQSKSNGSASGCPAASASSSNDAAFLQGVQ